MADYKKYKVGITVKEPWANDISYEVLDMSLYAVENGGDGCSYVALKDNEGVTPGSDATVWLKATQAGQSIYDLAVKYGHFVGTEEEFEAQYQQVLQDARDAATATNATNAEVTAAEALRVTAEQGRVSAESGRVSAEATRVSNEEGRVSAETARVTAEQGRASAESDRVSAEAARAAAETDRVSDFSALKTDMETAIGQADAATAAAVATNNQIQTAEAGRVSAEQGRVSAENARASAESARATAESSRATAETARVTAEGQRATAEGQRVTAENARVSAESGRAAAESARVTAEAARVSAETARESQASSDHTRAESDHTIAAEDHATLDEKIANKADIDGYYGGMTVGTAENLVGRGTTEAEYVNRRTSAGTADIGSGSAAITRIKGRSVVWNQLVDTNITSVSTISGHKYYTRISGVASIVSSAGNAISVTGTDNVIDLTLLGIDNLTTVEEVEAWLAENIGPLDYYAYNPGEVINNAAEGIKTRGFNLFNYATGKAYLPGKYSDYPYEYEICGTFTSISFTDVNGNTSVPELHEGRFFNVDAPGELTVVGGNNTDTLVHLVWSGWRNYGEPDYVYEPYWENTLNLGLTSLTGKLNGEGTSVVVFPHGLAKVGDVQDEIVGNRAIKRVGVVDMGTLNWNYDSTNQVFYATGVTGYMKANGSCLCSKYISELPATTSANLKDKSVSLNNAPIVRVKDSSFVGSTVADFKTAMNGTLLYYELATPEEYVLDNPPQFNYRVDDFSTEETVPSYDPANVIAPLAYDVQYAMNAVDAIRRLPDNYVERKDVKQVPGDSDKFVLSQKAVNDNYAKKVGVEDNLTVGLAKNIEGNATSGGYPFTFVKISGTDGLAKINDVRGNSLVWNQLYGMEPPTAISGHKYLISEKNSGTINKSISTSISYTADSTDRMCIDLTLMFGAGNEPATVEEFEALFPLPYYAYNAGEIISNKTKQVKAVGFNQFDGEYEDGALNTTTGEETNNDNTKRSKNYISVLPNTSYYCGMYTGTASNIWAMFFDGNKNLITGLSGITPQYSNNAWNIRNLDFNTPSNCAYIRFYIKRDSDICINLSDPSRNGQYEPYKTNTIELNLPTLTGKVNGEGESVVIASDGLKSAGSVYDEGIVENGYITKIVKRFVKIDLGDPSYQDADANGKFGFLSSPLSKRPSASSVAINAMCSKYSVVPFNKIYGMTEVGFGQAYDESLIKFYDPTMASKTSAQLKTALSGVELIYELAEPVTYVLDTPIPATFQSYKDGTLKQIPENGSVPTTAPHAMSVTYAIDIASIATGLPKDYTSADSLRNLLIALQSAGVIAGYTMTYDDTLQEYKFTISPVTA